VIGETIQAIEMHIARSMATRKELSGYAGSLSAEVFSDDEKVKTIDAFLFRFIKIQDLIGNKLFREVLDSLGEYQDSMSMLDVLDRMEKLQLIVSADQWLDFRNLRNLLTHEYPDNKAEIIEGIKTAMQAVLIMESCFRGITNYLLKRGR